MTLGATELREGWSLLSGNSESTEEGGWGETMQNLNAWGVDGPKTEVGPRKRDCEGQRGEVGPQGRESVFNLERSGKTGVEEKGVLENNLEKLKRLCQWGRRKGCSLEKL